MTFVTKVKINESAIFKLFEAFYLLLFQNEQINVSFTF